MTASLFARLAVASKVIALTKIPSVMSSDKKTNICIYIYLYIVIYLTLNFQHCILRFQTTN